MPQGKSIPFVEGEYPQIDGIEDGSQIKFSGTATKQGNELVIDSMDFEADNIATRELKTMTKNNTVQAGAGGKSLADQF